MKWLWSIFSSRPNPVKLHQIVCYCLKWPSKDCDLSMSTLQMVNYNFSLHCTCWRNKLSPNFIPQRSPNRGLIFQLFVHSSDPAMLYDTYLFKHFYQNWLMEIYVLRAYVSVQNAILKSNSKSQLTAYVLWYYIHTCWPSTDFCCVFCVGVSNGQHGINQSKGRRTATHSVLLSFWVRKSLHLLSTIDWLYTICHGSHSK